PHHPRPRRQAHPTVQGPARVGIQPHVLRVVHVPRAIPIEGDRGAREVLGPAPRVTHHLHAARVGCVLGRERASRGADRVASRDARHRPGQRRGGNERLVALDVQDQVELRTLFLRHVFRASLGARLGSRGRQYRFVASALDLRRDLARVGRDHDAACDPGVCCTTRDPDDEGFACQRQEWLAREAAGSKPRRNHTEDGHGGRYKSRAAESSLLGSGEETSHPVSGYGTTGAAASHTLAWASWRKFWSSRLPCSVPMDSGWNCTPYPGCLRCFMAMISVSLGRSPLHAVMTRWAGSDSGSTTSEWYRIAVTGLGMPSHNSAPWFNNGHGFPSIET